MKYAFTLIELIFVIVIIGILAVSAISKLAATRDDAETSKLATTIMASISEISQYAISQGDINSDMTVMSNTAKGLAGGVVTSMPNVLQFQYGGGVCVSLQLTDIGGGNFTLEAIPNLTTSDVCQNLQNLVANQQHSLLVKGTYVVY